MRVVLLFLLTFSVFAVERVVLEEVQRTRDSEIEEDDDFEGMSITYKEKDSGEENE